MADERNPYQDSSMAELRGEVDMMLRVLGTPIGKLVWHMVERAHELGAESVATREDTRERDLTLSGVAFEIKTPGGQSRWAHPVHVKVHRRLP